jgi:hopanoid-associated phosphorylase
VINGAGGDAAQSGPADERPVLIVTGLKQEARIAAGRGTTVICSSSNPVQLREMMVSFDPASIRGIVSFGVAGGLNPELKTGDVVIATEIVAGGQRWVTERSLTESLVALPSKSQGRLTSGILAGVEQVMTGQVGKAALRATTGADAVDMESHIAAKYAAENGLPFAAVRVISDPAHRALPELTMNAIKPNGNVDMWKMMRGIARHPKTIPHLISTGRDFNRALRSLRGCRGALGG